MRKMNSEINGVVNQLKKIKDVKGIYLFGSMAKDKATPISDIDICVITDRVNNDVKVEIGSICSERINVSLFQDLPINIQVRIFREGKELFIRDERFNSFVRSRTTLDFLDFKPILERYYEKALGMKYEI